MNLHLHPNESIIISGAGVNGSIVITNVHAAKLAIDGADHGKYKNIANYPDCNEARQPRPLGPALTEPFSAPLPTTKEETPLLDHFIRICEGPKHADIRDPLAAAHALRDSLSKAQTLLARTADRVNYFDNTNFAGEAAILLDRTQGLADGTMPDYKAIANELFDLLHDLQLAVREGDPRMQDLTEQAAELCDRVEANLKDK